MAGNKKRLDPLTKKERSVLMAKVRSSGNRSTELKFISLMRGESITGWRRNFPLEGKPDFVFPKKRIAVFVDGCFWHGHPTHCRLPKSNIKFWVKKIEANKRRDRYVNRFLRGQGWRVIRIWESDLSRVAYSKRWRRIVTYLKGF